MLTNVYEHNILNTDYKKGISILDTTLFQHQTITYKHKQFTKPKTTIIKTATTPPSFNETDDVQDISGLNLSSDKV